MVTAMLQRAVLIAGQPYEINMFNFTLIIKPEHSPQSYCSLVWICEFIVIFTKTSADLLDSPGDNVQTNVLGYVIYQQM